MKQEVEVQINGRTVKTYAHQGKLYIEAKDGTEFTLKLKNNSNSRVLAVTSIDGLNALTGEIATYDDTAGYIINGRSSYELKGWRVDDNTVNAFAFGKKDKSYAAKSDVTDGDTRNCGVLGIRFYEEKEKPRPTVIYRDRIVEKEVPYYPPVPWRNPWRNPYWISNEPTFTCSTSDMGCLASSKPHEGMVRSASLSFQEPAGFDMGVVFTDKEVEDKVVTVEFERGSLATFVEIYYASRKELERMGVPMTKEAAVAFPSSFQGSGYCKKPTRK